MQRILVTGGAGFIGSHLCEALLARGDDVVVFDDFNDFYDPRTKRANLREAIPNERFALIEGDICDSEGLRAAFEAARPEVVVHLAARAGVRPSLEDPNLYNRVNIIGSQNVLDCCREYGPSHLVFASSSSVYGGLRETPFVETMDVSRPISPYAATKRMNELMAHVAHEVYGLRVTLLRFFTVYGPRQRPDMAIAKFTRLVDEGEPVPMFGDGTTRRDYTYVDDIIAGLVAAVDRPFDYEIFNLGESRVTELRQLVGIIGAALGTEPQIDHRPEQPGDVAVTYANIDKARRMLGYDPSTSVEDGVRRYVAWYREQQHAVR